MSTKKTSIYEKIINVILDIFIFLFGIILLVSIYKGIQVKILGNDYSSFFGYSIFEVQTGSMGKAIKAGDWIIVKATDDIKLNDIVTYESEGEFITHRVIEAYNGTYITKGDANSAKDDPISKDQIVGKVEKTLKSFGIFRKTIFNPFVLITLIITLYLFSFVFRKNKKEQTESSNKEETIKKIDNFIDMILAKIKESFNKKVEKKMQQDKIDTRKEEKKIKAESKKETIKYEQVVPEVVKEETIEQPKIEEISDEELDKTMYFRAIKVDKDELDNTFLEIEKNKEKENAVETKEQERQAKLKAKSEKVEVVEVDDSLVKEGLEMLGKRNKKFKNIIDKIMYMKEQELEEIIICLNNNEKLQVNEASIKNDFIKTYVDVKYYNFCGNANAEYTSRNMTVKIVDTIKETSEKMIESYKGTDTKYEEKVQKYTNIFILIMYLEQVKGEIDDIDPIREMYKKKITKYSKNNLTDKNVKEMIENIIKIQRVYQGMVKYTLDNLETNTFSLNYNQLTAKKYMYALELDHNIAFSRVYSDYIVDKTYSEGIIAEDKVMIILSLLSIELVNNMLSSEFRKKYILYIPETIYEKENKLVKITKMMEDEFIKNNLYILVKYDALIKNKKVIKELRKSGYRFALVFDKTTEIKAKDRNSICIADYIFIDKKTVDAAVLLPNIPEELVSNIIYEEVGSKVGNYGGE